MKTSTLSAQEILDLYRNHGQTCYLDGSVTYLEHAWQCGQLAYYAEANAELQLACWLHDLGSLVRHRYLSPPQPSDEDQHERVGGDLIENLWGPEVAEPVRLHVQARRYMAAKFPHYKAKLSANRLLSLQRLGELKLQDCRAFECSPHHKAALLLQIWDEHATQPGWFAESRSDALLQLQALMKTLERGPAARQAAVGLRHGNATEMTSR